MPNPCVWLGLGSLFWKEGLSAKIKEEGQVCFADISESLFLDRSLQSTLELAAEV